MDVERKLVTELQGKLAELDQKVWQYGQDMAAEFEKYKETVLKDVPKELSDTVSKAIAKSMKDYKALYPVTNESEGSSSTGSTIRADDYDYQNNNLPALHTRPQPIAFRPSTIESADDSQHSRSPHARDEEFMGIITPSFLPLLGDSRKERRESDERRASLERRRSSDLGQPSVPARLNRSETSVDASTSTRSLSATPEPPRPAVPIRKNTDEASVASAASDLSESTYPRSALRRASNSSTRPSPRRVRFDFEGTEVLPTSSPLPAPTVMAEGIYDSDDDEPGSQQVEDIEEDSPPPKRISSSQKLRALSRKPLDEDDTVWTAVSAPDDGSPSVETDGAIDSFASGIATDGPPPALPLRNYSITSPSSAGDYGSTLQDTEDLPADDDIPGFSSIKGRTPIFPANILSPQPEDNDSPASPSRTPRPTWKTMHTVDEDSGVIGQGMRFGDDDQDELFEFDENTNQRSPPEELHDDSSDKDNSSEPPSPAFKPEGNSLFGRSPGRPIYRPEAQPSQATASLATSFKMNHPFSMPIVSEEIHAQAASMGPINSFVGSMNGRTGLDESNVASYRATGGFGSFAGGQSMTERMYLDDWKDEQAALKSRSKN